MRLTDEQELKAARAAAAVRYLQGTMTPEELLGDLEKAILTRIHAVERSKGDNSDHYRRLIKQRDMIAEVLDFVRSFQEPPRWTDLIKPRVG